MSETLGRVLMAASGKQDTSSFSGVVKHLRKVQLLDTFAKKLKTLAVQAQDAVTVDTAMNSSSILVAVRLRPFLKHDQTYDTKETCLDIEGSKISIEDVRRLGEQGARESKIHNFKFDVFLPKTVTQQRVYVATAKRILVKVLKGYNGTIFTYGQTGSGKTHTMLGDENDPGIIPRVGKDLIHEMERTRGKTAFKITASFVEIYREKISDLLSGVNDEQVEHDQDRRAQSSVLKAVAKLRRSSVSESSKGTTSTHQVASTFLRAHFHDHNKKEKKKGHDLKVRETKSGVEIVGVSMHPIHSNRDILYLLELGDESRHVASHALNSKSSRSHVIFTLYIEQSKVINGSAVRTKSKFNLIDLAGSERAERTGATGDLLKEGASINRSLSALGNVIKVLTDTKKKGKKKIHVPYRDSMLTRLLSDSLGGSASTLMCCNLAPGSDHYFETLSSLEFAKRVKKVKNTVKLRTEKLSQKEAKAMVNEADILRQEMLQMQKQHEKVMQSSQNTLTSDAHNELKQLRREMEMHRKQSVALSKITKATAANDRSILSDEGQTTAKTITDSKMARLFFVDGSTHTMSYIDFDGSEPNFEIGRGIIGHVAKTGKKLFVNMAPEDERFDPEMDEVSLTPTGCVGALLAVPVIGEGGDVIGVMAVARDPSKGPYTEDDGKLLHSICEHIAHAVDSHRKHENSSDKRINLATLTVSKAGQQYHNVMMQIASMCETRPKMAALTEELISDMIGDSHGTLFFVGGTPEQDDDTEYVWSMHMKPCRENCIHNMRGIVGDSIRTREIVNIATAEDHPQYHANHDSHPSSSAKSNATVCVPIMSVVGDCNSRVIAVLRVMRSGAMGAFGREDTAVIDLLAPYVSAGIMRIRRSDHEKKDALASAAKLEEMTKLMESVNVQRDEQERVQLELQEEVRIREIEMQKLMVDMEKTGIAAGTRAKMQKALENKKIRQAEAMQESLTAELETMRQQQAIMEEQFENAKKMLSQAERGQKTLKMRHMTSKASQLLTAVDDKQKKKQLMKAKKQAAAASQEVTLVQKKLTAEQKKTKRMQKAHEEEVRKFQLEVKRQEEELLKKKQALEKSMKQAKEKHVKKLVELKSKLRTYKSQVDRQVGNVKVERSRRISVALRGTLQSYKQDRLQETLRDMEEELHKQQREYEVRLAQVKTETSLVNKMNEGVKRQERQERSERSERSERLMQKGQQLETPRVMPNKKLQYSRQPLPPGSKIESNNKGSNIFVTSNDVSRHNKLLRQQQKLNPQRTRKFSSLSSQVLYIFFLCVGVHM
jgi:GAF domain-containing protein